jgi:DUF4097 and DUF4098 domain-containing protein YvlB
MQKKYYLIPVFVLCVLLIIAGCDFQAGGWFRAKYERTVHKQVPLDSGSSLVAKTSAGSITVTGADVSDCNVVALINVQAPTEQQAWEIAEQVDIILEKVGNALTVKAEEPPKKQNCSVSVSYNITVPKQTNVDCTSSYGPVKFSNIHGDAKAKSSSGSIRAEYIKGSSDLNTSYGSINCEDVSGPVVRLKSSSGGIRLTEASGNNFDVHTSYGSIKADRLMTELLKLHSGSGSIDVTRTSADSTDLFTSYGRITCRQLTTADLRAESGSGNINIACSDSTLPEINANVITSYGSVDFQTPPDFTGQVDMSTDYGTVNTQLPITTSGKISKKKLAGTIGRGNGKLYLKTSSGSIKIR